MFNISLLNSLSFDVDVTKFSMEPIEYKKNVLFILSTLNKKDDSVLITNKLGNIEDGTWPSKNICVSGAVKIDYPDSDEISEVGNTGDIFPLKQSYKTNKFLWTAISDNAKSLCVHPYNNIKLVLKTNQKIIEKKQHVVKEGTVFAILGPFEYMNKKIDSLFYDECLVSFEISLLPGCQIIEFNIKSEQS